MTEKIYKIAESAMQPTEALQYAWTVIAPHGTPREATLASIFWTHVARKLRPLSKVNVIAEDGSWYQELLILVADGMDVRMKELGFWQLDDTTDVGEMGGDSKVEWAGPHHQFRVIRNTDGVVLEKGFRTKQDAFKWMAGNSRVPS